ncbi:ABC transporter ATP-binding protein [Cohaesibacter celericrescens]|uniref:ABC transporter ATP-binding protein n=1 Tax=Cohaesibacter celericrescens TaxID=2067669 RepID=A0A2N5XPL6_9HYPH|nr:ABC transporter ATP-binding protein [Cohaesibacter celericrescens]PLW76443.1 ABC transporter ATP-binding protein [Cohaesibacter celericrescens]
MSIIHPVHHGRSIALHGISKVWEQTRALDNVDITIPAGSFTALLGPSGCGKSTLLRIIAGLEQATEGKVHIGDEDVTHRSPDKRYLSMVFQSYALFPHLDVAENIIFGLRTRKEPKRTRGEKLLAVAELMGLEKLLGRKPAELSGGQQQRVALARAVIAERSICLMDEPLSNLDAKLRHEMRLELRALQQKLGFTMVYVTHDQAEAITMADQVVLLNEGKVEQVDSPRALYDKPSTLFAARFIGTPPMSLFDASALGALGQNLQSRSSSTLLVGLRPEAINLAEDGALKATISSVEFLGADTMLDCLIADETITVRASGRSDFTPGTPITLSFASEDLALFDKVTGARIKKPQNPVEALQP